MDPRCRLLARGPLRRGDVVATFVDLARPSTPPLDAHVERSWAAALERARREGRELFDGPVVRWIASERRGDRLELLVGRGRYRDFVATNLDPSIRPDVAGGTVPWSHYGNAIGTSALVVARGGELVLGRRSTTVLGYAGHLHAFGGMLEAQDARAATADLFASLERELAEEVGVAPRDLAELTLRGVILEPRIHQPEAIFEARTTLTVAQLRERWRDAPSRAEHAELVELVDDDATIEAQLERLGPVSPIGRACLALHFG